MSLKYPGEWRFSRSKDVTISESAIDDFFDLIGKVAAQGDRWSCLEQFKTFFANAAGATDYQSSSESWAATDLLSYMRDLSTNPPLFLEAFYDACQSFQDTHYKIPDLERINEICRDRNIGYQIAPPDLIKLDDEQKLIPIPDIPPTLAESSVQILNESLSRGEKLLMEKRPREAVQEMLWILESISTAFKGMPLASGNVEGKYFNEIAKELKKAYPDSTLNQMLKWINTLHGYLSSPTGGGIRHGIDLNDGKPITLAEARLFCNLIRSYIGFLLSEYERLVDSAKNQKC